MPGTHQIGRKTKGHPLLWLAVLSICSVCAVWGAVSFLLAAQPSIRLMDPDTRSEAHVSLIVNTVAQVVGGMVMGFYAFRVGRLCLKMYGPRPSFPPGHCRRCGYDLTSSVSSMCPECGRTKR